MPIFVAVNPTTNRIYVPNAGDSLSVIDGNTISCPCDDSTDNWTGRGSRGESGNQSRLRRDSRRASLYRHGDRGQDKYNHHQEWCDSLFGNALLPRLPRLSL